MTETEGDGFSNEDVELPELEAFPYSDIAEGEITLSIVLLNGDDTEDEFAAFSFTDWLRTTELDDFLILKHFYTVIWQRKIFQTVMA